MENLKIQNTKDLELKEDRIKITELTNKISKLEEEKSEISTFVENIRYEISEDEKAMISKAAEDAEIDADEAIKTAEKKAKSKSKK